MYNILWTEDAWNEYVEWQSEDRKTLKKINVLIKDIQRSGLTGLGKAEPLKGWDEGTENGPDRSALLGHNFVYQETKPHGFYSSYFHQRISS